MASWCDQSVTLVGKPEKIKEAIDFVIRRKTKEFDNGTFYTDQFPISLCSMKENEIILQTKYGAPYKCIEELSSMFPEVGFISTSFTDGTGIDQCAYILGGSMLYHTYLEVQAPEYWEDTTGYKMEIPK